MDTTIANMKSNAYEKALVTDMEYMDQYLRLIGRNKGKEGYIEIKTCLHALVDRWKDRQYRTHGVFADMLCAADILEKRCDNYLLRHDRTNKYIEDIEKSNMMLLDYKDINNHVVLVYAIRVRAKKINIDLKSEETSTNQGPL